MSLLSRIRMLFGAKAHAALDRLEDPVQTLEVAYRKQLDALQDVRKGIADVLTSEKRLEIERDRYGLAEDRARALAADALKKGDEAGARSALERVAVPAAQRDRLLAEIDAVRAQRESLQKTAADLERRVEALRVQKLALAARLAAAKATTRAAESVTGLSDDMNEVGKMVDRARDQSLQIQARAAALAQLAGATAPGEADARTAEDAWVERELRALGSPSTEPPALPGSG